MSATAQYANIVEIELNRWIEKEFEALEENISDLKTQLENIEGEKARLKIQLAVWEGRCKALQQLKNKNGSVGHQE